MPTLLNRQTPPPWPDSPQRTAGATSSPSNSPEQNTPAWRKPEPPFLAPDGAKPSGASAPASRLDYLSRNSSKDVYQTRCISPKGWLLIQCKHGSRIYKPLRCKQCEGCRAWRVKKLLGRISSYLNFATWTSFVTLTTRPGTPWPYIMRRWQSFVKALRKTYGQIEYVWVKEEGSNTGMRHLHAVLTGPKWIDKSLLRKLWFKRTGAFQVGIRRLDNSSGISHAAKYVVKSDVRLARAVGFSKGWPKLTFNSPDFEVNNVFDPPVMTASRSRMPDGTIVDFHAPGCDCFPALSAARDQGVVDQVLHKGLSPPLQPSLN